MEHSKNSSSSSNDDERRAAALREIGREQSLVMQLRAVVLPALQLAGGDRGQVVADMFKSILDCSAKAMAELKLLRLDKDDRSPDDDVVDDKRRVRKIILSGDGDNAKQRRRRRRLADDSVTLETLVPDYDGHQWRKYGQKLIRNAKHPRSYYKCTYMQEQGCRATKTVQQQQEVGRADDPAMYAVVYYGQHTCKPGADADAAVAETGHSADELARSDSQCSNISVTCTSIVIDHQHNRTASVESDYNLLEMAPADFAGAEVNAPNQLLDVDVFLPFDLVTDWETDAHAYGLLKYGDW